MFRPADQPAPERSRHRRHIFGLKCALRRATAGSWWLSKLWYSLHGLRIRGGPSDPVWYVAYGANMHDGAFRERRGMQPLEWHLAGSRAIA